jgi:hypothetical protein
MPDGFAFRRSRQPTKITYLHRAGATPRGAVSVRRVICRHVHTTSGLKSLADRPFEWHLGASALPEFSMIREITIPRRCFVAASASLLSTLTRGSRASAEESALAVIVNARNPQSPTRREIALMFRGTLRNWSDGSSVVAINTPPSSPDRVLFDQAVLNLTPSQVARYWIDRRIRGEARPPRIAPNTALVAHAVGRLGAAIGYVPSSQVGKHVRIVAWLRNGALLTSVSGSHLAGRAWWREW